MKISEFLDDATRRVIETKARADVAAGQPDPPAVRKGTYQRQLLDGAREHIYLAAYYKREARLKRMGQR